MIKQYFLPSLIESLRRDRGWTQVDLAKKCFVSQGFISKVEAGLVEPDFKMVKQIMEVFGYEVIFEERENV